MARTVYGYIPSQPDLCDTDGTICNSDFGFSFGRGKFKFSAGQYVHSVHLPRSMMLGSDPGYRWQNIAVYSKMNDPSESNGVIAL